MGMKFKCIGAVAIAAVAFTSAANAAVIFEDNFDAIGAPGVSTLNWGGNADWSIVNGTVDLVSDPNIWGISCEDGQGKCIDLDGSTGNAGELRTASLVWSSGQTFTVEFDLSGNQRSISDETVQIMVTNGNDLVEIIEMTSAGGDANWEHFSFSFLGNGNLAQLTFANTGGDNVGAMLDNVRISQVPEPGLLGLFGFGLVGMGALARRRRS
jgi:hypothetical protein